MIKDKNWHVKRVKKIGEHELKRKRVRKEKKHKKVLLKKWVKDMQNEQKD